MNVNWRIQPIQPTEWDAALSLPLQEGWNTEPVENFEYYRQRDPDGYLLAWMDGRPVGICLASSYHKNGFIGNLIVAPEARGQGLGAALLNQCVNYLKSRGNQTVSLDANPKAVPLYLRNGFRILTRSFRFSGILSGQEHAIVRPMQPGDLPAVFALDRRLFAEDRSYYLQRKYEVYPHLSRVMVENGQLVGFIMGRSFKNTVNAGPWVVAENASDPVKLLESFALSAGGLPILLGILASNTRAVEIARSLNFELLEDHNTWRMASGPSADLGAAPGCLAISTASKG